MGDSLNLMRDKAREANVSVSVRALAKELLVASRRPTAGLRLKPSFFLIGSMKAGTTSLFNNLIQHPMIAEPLSKEIRFFDFHYERGRRWYLAHFPLEKTAKKRGETLTGEASPSYLFDPHAPRRIKRFESQAKLVVLLRNPVDRAYSHYQHAVRYWGETRSFEEAAKVEEEWIGEEQRRRMLDTRFMGVRRIHHSYLTRGRYLEQLQRWEKMFPRAQMLVLKAEDYFERPETVMPRVLEFLNLPKWEPDSFRRLNMANYKQLDPGVRDWMYDYFAESNQALYSHLGTSFEWEAMR